MKEFFENLKNIRIQKGLSLEEIARKSRMNLTYLKNIEAGELDKLPKGYDRIFFKRYLREIGEDKEEVWRDFNLFFGTGPLQKNVPYSSDITGEEEEPEPETTRPVPREDLEKKPSLYQKIIMKINLDKVYLYFWIILTVIILGTVGYFAYRQYVFVKSIPPEIKEISVSEYVSEMQKQDSLLTPQLTENSQSSVNPASSMLVELRTLERTWVREIKDEKDTTEYILSQGINRKISADSTLKFMLGRADGVEIWLNGDSLGIMGDAQEVVVNLVLTADGIVEKRLKTPVRQNPPAPDTTANAPAEADTLTASI
jgi:cytoskeletal protein RodZ